MLSRMSLLRIGAYSAGVGTALFAVCLYTGHLEPCGPSDGWIFVPFVPGGASLLIGLVLLLMGNLAKLLRERNE